MTSCCWYLFLRITMCSVCTYPAWYSWRACVEQNARTQLPTRSYADFRGSFHSTSPSSDTMCFVILHCVIRAAMQLGTSLSLCTVIDWQQGRYPSSRGMLQGETSTLTNCYKNFIFQRAATVFSHRKIDSNFLLHLPMFLFCLFSAL